MFSSGASVLKSCLAAAIIVTLISPPSFAAGGKAGFDLGGEHLNDCYNVRQSERALKRKGYTEINLMPDFSTDTLFWFVALKPKRDGKVTVWHLHYDGCEREILRKESQE